VEDARRYLAGLDERASKRLRDAFENRQDALISFLDERGMPDEAFGEAHELLYRLWAMLEAGWPAGIRSLTDRELSGGSTGTIPEALRAFVEAQLASGTGAAEAKRAVEAGLSALWSARRS
jgi:hypothetical protein